MSRNKSLLGFDLLGQPGPNVESLRAGFIKMIQNMDASDFEGLYQAMNGGPINSAITNMAAAATAAKSTPYTEQERVQEIESWRNPENTRFIDEAIASGESPEAAALRIVKASLEEQATVNGLAAETNRLLAERSKSMATQAQATPVATGDETADAIIAEIQNKRHRGLWEDNKYVQE